MISGPSNILNKEVVDILQLIELKELQKLQDLFADVHHVASSITYPDGRQITKPSNFCSLCKDIIRQTEKGRERCLKSKLIVGKFNPDGPTFNECKNIGLMDAVVNVTIGDKHIANWSIGQVRCENHNTNRIAECAQELGVDKDLFLNAFNEVPFMEESRLHQIVSLLNVYVNQFVENAYNKYRLNQANKELKEISNCLPDITWKAEWNLVENKMGSTYISKVADELLLLPPGTINNSLYQVLSYVLPQYVDDLYETFHKALQNTGVVYSAIYEARMGDGTIGWFQGRGRSYREGNIIKFFGVTKDISKLKKTELSLKKLEKQESLAQEHLKLAMEVTLDGHWDRNLITNETYFSPRWKEILGYAPNELPNDFYVWERLTKPEDVKKSQRLLKKLISGERDKLDFEVQMKHKDGSWKHILVRAGIIFNDKKEAIRVLGTNTDITEKKRISQQLKDNEKRYRELAQHLPSGVAVYRAVDDGRDFMFVGYNAAAERMYNTSKDKKIGHLLFSEFPNIRQTPLYKGIKKVYQTGVELHIPPFLCQGNKSSRWCENYIYKLPSGEIVSIFNDVSDIKIAKEELKKQNEELRKAKLIAEENGIRFKALHDASFGGIAIHDKGIIIDVNQGMEKLTGYSQKELIGMDYLSLFDPNSCDIVENKIITEFEKRYEAVACKKNGETFPVEMHGNMIPYKETKVRVTEIRDISASKRMIIDLQRSKKRAEQSDKLKSAFLANIRHEIRTPMNGIMGFMQLLQTPDLTDQEKGECSTNIIESSDRLLTTINNIIEFSQIEADDIQLKIKEVDLYLIFQYHLNSFQMASVSKGLNLVLDISDALSPTRIKTDVEKLDSILNTLLDNAIKFTSQGEIHFGYELEKDHIRCYVRDNGIGIPKKQINSIFDGFMQADFENTRSYEGSGLGLSICKGYVEKLGGKIWLESEYGKGSTFYFTLRN
ncbi:PocR ligand-binding domain-containing protein [Ancylomarina sp. 16SWW S1-10-2]|uniref:PocR ligand-binding domain-containing protein n=1 Tax=Ancylomarina sp. 16SWW S1-10-2 TaxID=2499681 RepID=UPI0018A0DB0E